MTIAVLQVMVEVIDIKTNYKVIKRLQSLFFIPVSNYLF